jgi:2-polyprenyl-3-methyl-5-hydroxy-6-metoxy-1,4-benzoquinol methylase
MNTFSSEATGFDPEAVDSFPSPAQVLAEVTKDYPPPVRESQLLDVERIVYHIELVQRYGKSGGRICDIGGGVGLFSPGCAALGYGITLVDHFKDEINFSSGEDVFVPHARRGVKIMSCDVIAEPLDFPENSFDVVTAFDSMEHWQHSPRRLFHMLRKALAPAGIFIIGVPKRKNLARRLTTLLGRGHRSVVRDWYNSDIFRDDVREPRVSDLRYICRDLDMAILAVIGRNWLDRMSYPLVAKLTDPVLRMRPGLCSDLYVVAAIR